MIRGSIVSLVAMLCGLVPECLAADPTNSPPGGKGNPPQAKEDATPAANLLSGRGRAH